MQSFTVAGPLRIAMRDAAVTAINDPAVQIEVGYPWPQTAADIVAVGAVRSTQEPATLGTQRSREETLTVDVLVSVFRAGGQEVEQVASDRAYALLGALERHVRITDTTLGGVVRHCFLTGHEMDSQPFSDDTGMGRTVEIAATFTAAVRITG